MHLIYLQLCNSTQFDIHRKPSEKIGVVSFTSHLLTLIMFYQELR